jgi:lantibiotic modifying enzyme
MNDYAVHFCHGAPGAISLFLEAYEIYKDQRYLDTAIKSGECTWKYGLIKKGYGLCHGICGNAYFLMRLYIQTGDEKWKKRAHEFII